MPDSKIKSSLLESWTCTEHIPQKDSHCKSYSYGAVALYQNVVSHFWGSVKYTIFFDGVEYAYFQVDIIENVV